MLTQIKGIICWLTLNLIKQALEYDVDLLCIDEEIMMRLQPVFYFICSSQNHTNQNITSDVQESCLVQNVQTGPLENTRVKLSNVSYQGLLLPGVPTDVYYDTHYQLIVVSISWDARLLRRSRGRPRAIYRGSL